jgi:hypothetical protein
VIHQLRQRMTYANVMSTVAVFIALGGSSYAAVKISGTNLKNRSVAAVKLKRNSVTGREIRESRLGRVRRAATADRVGGLTGDELRLHCPLDTLAIVGVCVERTPRSPAPYGSAVLECLRAGGITSSGRRLPSHGELMAALTAMTLAPNGELTADVYPSSANPGRVDVLVVVNQVGGVSLASDTAPEGSRQYRCVTGPMN